MAIEIADLEKMGEEWWEHRINELDDIEKRKELLKELDALRSKVRWYERNFGRKGTTTNRAYMEMYAKHIDRYSTYAFPTYIGYSIQEAEISRLRNIIYRMRIGKRIRVNVNPDPWCNYSLEDAYEYLKKRYGARDGVIFLCLVKEFGEQKVAIGKLFYKPQRIDKLNKKRGHEPDDSTYIRFFEKLFYDATSRYALKIKH